MKTRRVLSIQSHVVHGYVGNRAATFPLQYCGWDVDALNTVNFSNHPGYGKFTGKRASPSEVLEVFEGLMEIGCEYDSLLTGYVPDAQTLSAVHKLCVQYLQRHHDQHTTWILDPVLGDNGKLYVSKDVIPVYEEMLRSGLVNLVTPNQFEMEVLTGIKIDSFQTLKLAILEFNNRFKVQNVVVTSVMFPGLSNTIICAGCTLNSPPFYYKVPVIEAKFSGSGDLFCAILMDRYCTKGERSLPIAVGEALTVVEDVLQLSLELAQVETANPYIKDLEIILAKNFYAQNNNRFELCSL